MKIKEVSAITGLTRKTIRFYEDSGLIQPQKNRMNGRDFREYSEQDLQRLGSIAVLRKAHFTIDEIRQMQNNPQAVQEIFAAYYARVKTEKQELDRLVCVLDSIADRRFASETELVQEITEVTEAMQLPRSDIHPRFRYLDELEEKMSPKVKKRKKKNRDLEKTAALTQVSSMVQCHTKPGVRDGSMSGTSVIMAMRMMDDE